MKPLHASALILIGLILAMSPLAGCSSQSVSMDYQTIRATPNRDPEKAHQLDRQARALIEQAEYEKAEAKLKQALTADITYGPAHNNLGKVYFLQHKQKMLANGKQTATESHRQSLLHLAAWEFEYATKLMPYRPEPRNNLGMVFEEVGRFDDAVEAYTQALGLQPDHPQVLGNLCRARIRRGDKDRETRKLLSDMILRDPRPEWVDWAKKRLTSLNARKEMESTIEQ